MVKLERKKTSAIRPFINSSRDLKSGYTRHADVPIITSPSFDRIWKICVGSSSYLSDRELQSTPNCSSGSGSVMKHVFQSLWFIMQPNLRSAAEEPGDLISLVLTWGDALKQRGTSGGRRAAMRPRRRKIILNTFEQLTLLLISVY